MKLRLAIILLSALAALVSTVAMIPAIDIVFVLLGLALGGFAIQREERTGFLLITLALHVSADALTPIPMVGIYLTMFLANLSALFKAAAVAVITLMLAARLKR